MFDAPADLLQWLGPIGVYGTTFVVCFISGLIPLVNSEAYLLAVAAFTPLSAAVPLTFLAALGQMVSKMVLYGAGRGVVRLPFNRYQGHLSSALASLEARRGRTGAFLFLSALGGFPPFYLVSVAAGTLRLPTRSFFSAGLAGRFFRFGLFVVLPKIVQSLFW